MASKILAFFALAAVALAVKEEMEPSMTPEATPTPAICFPASAKVNTESGSVKQMDQLSVGDRVQVGKGQFSEVFAFTHKHSDITYDFLQLTTASGAVLRLTDTHFLPLNGELVAARQAKLGDLVELASGETSEISKIDTVSDKGLYNPQTAAGDIVVDGVRASTYTETIEYCAAHALLAPLRALAAKLGFYTTALDKAHTILA